MPEPAAFTWPNLLSGLIGAVVGAGSTVLATYLTIKSSVQQNERLLQREQEHARRAVWFGLLIEMRENHSMMTNLAPNGLQLKVPFLFAFWQSAKSNLHFLPIELQGRLIRAYALIAQHNELVLYDRHALDWGMGTLNTPIANLQVSVLASLQEVLPELEALLRGNE